MVFTREARAGIRSLAVHLGRSARNYSRASTPRSSGGRLTANRSRKAALRIWIGLRACDPLHCRELVESSVEGEDSLDTMALHDREVDCITGRNRMASQHNCFRPLNIVEFDRKDLVDETENSVKGGLDGVAAVD